MHNNNLGKMHDAPIDATQSPQRQHNIHYTRRIWHIILTHTHQLSLLTTLTTHVCRSVDLNTRMHIDKLITSVYGMLINIL